MGDIRPDKCRGCQAPIQWKWTPAGRWMPLDMDPLPVHAAGSYVLEGEKRCRPVEPLLDTGKDAFMNHWTTCPVADQFKAKAKKS